MVTQGYTPQRGDIIWMNFNPTRGHEQKGKRPHLILSPEPYNTKSVDWKERKIYPTDKVSQVTFEEVVDRIKLLIGTEILVA